MTVVPGAGGRAAGRTPDPPVSLAALLIRSGEGDQLAFARVYRATSPRVFGLALHILSDPLDAEEATLDAYAAIWRRAASYDPSKGNPIAWILSITRSKAIDVLRARRRASRVALPGVPPEPVRTPETQTSIGERCEHVRRVLCGLPLDQRVAIELAYFEGLSHREVAEALGEALGTVKSRIRLAMSSLRRELGASSP